MRLDSIKIIGAGRFPIYLDFREKPKGVGLPPSDARAAGIPIGQYNGALTSANVSEPVTCHYLPREVRESYQRNRL